MAGIDEIRFGEDGLAPAVVQDVSTGEVLMLGYMNREMLAKTLETGDAWFWSRSRRQPWHKGETSGNFIRVREVRRNCYDDSLLLLAEPAGPTCHTGARSCYFRRLDGELAGEVSVPALAAASAGTPPLPGQIMAGRAGGAAGEVGEGEVQDPGLDWLFDVVRRRQQEQPEGSYVAKLLAAGVDRIAKKVGEEAAEVIIAAKNRSAEELAGEMADLWFHSLVLLADASLEPKDVYRVLATRHHGQRQRRHEDQTAPAPTQEA